MSTINTTLGLINKRILAENNGFGFLYLTILLIYGHAIGYNILSYYKPGSEVYMTFLVGLILLVVLLQAFFRILNTMRVSGGSVMLFLILYVLSGALSIINTYLYFGTVDIKQYAIGFYRNILPVALAFLAYSGIRNLNQAFKLFLGIALINGFLAMIGLFSYLFADDWARFYVQLTQEKELPLHFGGVLRMTSVLWNPLVFGVLMALNSILAWNGVVNAKEARFLWIAIFCFSAIGTVLSFTRTGWIMFAIGMLTSLLFLRITILHRVLRAAVVVIGVLFVLLSIELPRGYYKGVSEAILDHIIASFEHEDIRIQNLEVNLFRIAENPIGYGLGTAGYAALPTRGIESPVVFSDYIAADNNYLSMALQVGIHGLIFFMYAQASALMKILMKLEKTADAGGRMILATAGGWIVGMVVGALFLNIWEYNLVPHVVFAVLGISLRVCDLHS
jgi:hypothetical protein